MAGAQAQVLSAAQMSLWARTRGTTLSDVQDALWKDRTLVKAWCMRASLHLIPSVDFAVFVRGCARREARQADWFARAGIPMGPVNRVVDAVPRILEEPLTRKEIVDRLKHALHLDTRQKAGRGWGGSPDAQGLVIGGRVLSAQWIVFTACMRGLACFGPMRGTEATFVRPERWLRTFSDLSQEEAEKELLRRYLRAHGPATVQDFAQWTYMKADDARTVWRFLEEELTAVVVDSRAGWILRADVTPLERAAIDSPTVRLLPFFDSLLLGLKDKSHLVDADHYKSVYRPAGWLAPVVLVDGRVAGTWSHTWKPRSLSVKVEEFRPWGSEIGRRVREEVDDLGRFLQADEIACRFAKEPARGRPRSRARPRR